MPSSRAVPTLRKFLGARLRAMRRARGLSQSRLGDQAGVSGKFVGEVERGVKSISMDTLHHVASALRIPITHLLPEARKVPSAPEEAHQVFALLTGLRAADQRRAGSVLRALAEEERQVRKRRRRAAAS